MKKLIKKQWINALLTIGLLLSATVICLLARNVFTGSANTQLMFLLVVLLVSYFTDGYLWGILASLIAVPIVNYIFTYPYFAFNLSISGYLLTFITLLAVSLIISVLTTRLKKQERLRGEAETEKLRANLLRAVSHDLRTPLTSIVGATGAILDNELSLEKQRELIEDANTDAQWLLRMIENLLAITRISGNRAPLHLETEVVEDVLAEAVIKFQKHFAGIRVDMEMCDDILLADMDAVLVEQVVLNLLENAVYHGQRTTRIVLQTEHDGHMVLVTVLDNGAGIAKEKLAKLFNGSVHGDGHGSADAQKHMGIGLSVCMSIITAHGGTMSAHNEAKGGASFTFTLQESENDFNGKDTHR
ncbi:MAG: DUF4118 domain-containing protein [Clostridia bacterium]